MWVGHLITVFVGEAFLNGQVLGHYDTVRLQKNTQYHNQLILKYVGRALQLLYLPGDL